MDSITLQQHPFIGMLFDELKDKYQLTRRENEVLQIFTLNGWTNRELGDALNLSEKTMKNHIASIQRKFNVNSSREIQAVVFRSTLLPAFLNGSDSQNSQEGKRPYAALSS
ncbi:response regulator transcription factor [Cohnella soli]|uniref:Response regulator transcription factor n=1 Tax=Cohnella soli TaxID=425005 RepID=A0ABW0HMY5_9BACL